VLPTAGLPREQRRAGVVVVLLVQVVSAAEVVPDRRGCRGLQRPARHHQGPAAVVVLGCRTAAAAVVLLHQHYCWRGAVLRSWRSAAVAKRVEQEPL
jgi:hypothetical protein